MNQITKLRKEYERKFCCEGYSGELHIIDYPAKGVWNWIEHSLQEERKIAEKLSEYVEHEDDCILTRYEAGRPTKNGYEQKIAGKWYQVRPVNKLPKCECGLDDVLDLLTQKHE